MRKKSTTKNGVDLSSLSATDFAPVPTQKLGKGLAKLAKATKGKK